MVIHAWHGIIVLLTSLSLIMGCASSPYIGTGAAVGGGLGALTGAAIGHKNPWAGALIGGLVGTGLGAAGGYMVQQRQAQSQPQGSYSQQPPPGYSQQPPPGYSAPAPPGYSNQGQAPGPAYGGYNTPSPVTPQGSEYYSAAPAAPPEAYSQAPAPSSVHTPITPAPYNTYE